MKHSPIRTISLFWAPENNAALNPQVRRASVNICILWAANVGKEKFGALIISWEKIITFCWVSGTECAVGNSPQRVLMDAEINRKEAPIEMF